MMPSDYERICEENVRRRGTEFDDIGDFLAQKLYGDRSHFIYELLQNAEDALVLRRKQDPGVPFGTGVTFRLLRDRLEVSHRGKLFDEADVRGICDVLRGTKRERLDQIGTFGIGFKSVYAFTRHPEVHSGCEHFVIERYIRPRSVPPRSTEADETLFHFPFDHPDLPADQAFELIRDRLLELGPHSLLFLREVTGISWCVEGTGEGSCVRQEEDSDAGRLVVIRSQNALAQDEEAWLLFERPVPLGTSGTDQCIVAAFQAHRQEGRLHLVPLDQSPLTAFFPTARETNLGFLVHGPFVPTAARDNIDRQAEWNRELLRRLGQLVAESLEVCRDAGLLGMDTIKCLPIDATHFPDGSDFRPVFDAVLTAFKERPLVPTDSGGFCTASQAVLARTEELAALVSTEMLSTLLGTEGKQWVVRAVTESGEHAVWEYLRRQCGVDLVDPEHFAGLLTKQFLEATPDEWMIRFYQFLGRRPALWRKEERYCDPPRPRGLLRGKPILRCEDGQHLAPFSDAEEPLAYLPVERDVSLPVVKRAICADEGARRFLVLLGLVEPDVCAVVLSGILPRYRKQGDIPFDEHQRDVAQILAAWQLKTSPRHGEVVAALRSTPWLFARRATGGNLFRCLPDHLYLKTEELAAFFQGNEAIWFAEEDSIDDDTLIKLGVSHAPRVFCRGLAQYRERPCDNVRLLYSRGKHEYGERCFDPDTSIEGLEFALDHVTLERARFAWNYLLLELVPFLHGTVARATRWDFSNAVLEEVDSRLGALVKSKAWLPVQSGEFRRPCDCTVDQLHPDLGRNEDLAKALGVKPDPTDVQRKDESTRRYWLHYAGIQEDVADVLVAQGETLTGAELSAAIALYREQGEFTPEFPIRVPMDRDRRTTKVAERVSEAPDKTYEPRERSTRASVPPQDPKAWLADQYTNADGLLICQMCHREMPFRLRGGQEYYFEAVQVADDLGKEDHALYLALCPLCSAKYKVLLKKDSSESLVQFLDEVRAAQTPQAEADLGVERVIIRFVQTHLLDLQTVLKAVAHGGPGKAE